MTFTVTPVFVLTVKPATITTAPPGNNPEALTLSLVNGFNGSVKLNCTLPCGSGRPGEVSGTARVPDA
jgi:hypothetical protein